MGHEDYIHKLAFEKGAQGAAWTAVFAIFIAYWLSFIPRLWIGAFKREVESDNIKVFFALKLPSRNPKRTEQIPKAETDCCC